MHTERKPRTALWAFAGFAVAGLLNLGAGLYFDDTRITMLGAGALVLAFVLGLTTETFRIRAANIRAARADLPAATPNARPIEYNYIDQEVDASPAAASLPKVWNPAHGRPVATGVQMDARNAAAGEEDLVEFELVEEKQAPTRLVVPSSFHHARTENVAAGEITVTTGAALARRKEMVSGLPLVSSILTDEPPAATQVTHAAPGKTRGQCSACGTMLWAPTQRPLRLRCPRCGHVRTLTE